MSATLDSNCALRERHMLFFVNNDMTKLALNFTMIVSLVFILVGCQKNHPDVGEVQGIVTLDGRALPDARVTFYPLSGGRSSQAVSDQNGRYELTLLHGIKGTMLGKNAVSVSTAAEAEYDEENGDRIIRPARHELIPAKYNANSTLVFEVKAGSNEINLDLLSDENDQSH